MIPCVLTALSHQPVEPTFSLCYFTGESTLYPHCAVTKVVEDECFMAHVHVLCSSVSDHLASSAGVASAAVTAVAVVQGPIRPAGPQYNVT